ncbi:MAG TPA: porphobilinogen synthase [Candidatus Limnocylindrales bacterium]
MTTVERGTPGTSVARDQPDAGTGFAPTDRPRRLRRTGALRDLVRETRLHPKMLVAPIFVRPGTGIRRPISSLPGVDHVSADEALRDAERYARLGIGGVILFGVPDDKDEQGSGAWARDGVVQQALRLLHTADLPLALVADTCLCEYTSHGHCGPMTTDGEVDNDLTLAVLARTAVAQAQAGADIVAPSAMMDGQVSAIRAALDDARLTQTVVMAYAAKAASAFYGPFRDAAGSTPAFGDRRGYQMDPANRREAMREIALDVDEDADIVMIKPALPQLDLIAEARARWDLPIAAYQVSGEYAMLAAAAERGWLDRRRATLEALTGIARAGADIVITYAATDVCNWLSEEAGT